MANSMLCRACERVQSPWMCFSAHIGKEVPDKEKGSEKSEFWQKHIHRQTS